VRAAEASSCRSLWLNTNTVGARWAELGEEAFATAWAKGQAMTLEQAIAYALEDDTPPHHPEPTLTALQQTWRLDGLHKRAPRHTPPPLPPRPVPAGGCFLGHLHALAAQPPSSCSKRLDCSSLDSVRRPKVRYATRRFH